MSVNLPEAKKKEGMLDTLSTITSIASSAYNIADKAGSKDPKKPDDTTAMSRRAAKLNNQATV